MPREIFRNERAPLAYIILQAKFLAAMQEKSKLRGVQTEAAELVLEGRFDIGPL